MTTDALQIAQLATNEAQPDVKVNEGFDIFDAAIAGEVVIEVLTDANISIGTTGVPAEWQYSLIRVYDAPSDSILTTARDVIYPDVGRRGFFTFTNDTAQTLTLKRSGQTGVAVTTGTSVVVRHDGTDIEALSITSAIDAGDVAFAPGSPSDFPESPTTVQAALDALAGRASGGSSLGRHAVPIMAGSMSPSSTGGCAALARIASAANQPDIVTLDFDPSTVEYAQFAIPMPKSWNEGTITFLPLWSHAATTTNFGVVWSLQAVAVSNDDTIAVNFGTAQTSTDTGGTTNDIYFGPESSAITVAGSPVAKDLVFFRLSRVATDGSDTLAIDARLHGIVLYMSTDAGNDA